MPTKPDTETRWDKPHSDGVYWWRLNPADTPDAVMVKGDVFYDFAESEPTAITLGEFLGPIRPEDFEQLVRLRQIAEDALEFRVLMHGRCDHEKYMTKLCMQCVIREALAPTEEKKS